jgi:ABC-type Zn uptake system ZnuABC Zn-binding protein ZnuA
MWPKTTRSLRNRILALSLPIGLLVLAGCTAVQTLDQVTPGPAVPATTPADGEPPGGLAPLTLPDLQPADLDGGKLRVVATTSIIGDVVSQVGGESIELVVLMEPGQDPHGFEPSAGDLTAAAEAHVIFINGWDLEEGLVEDLRNVSTGIPLVPVSAGIPPLPIGGYQADAATSQQVERADPHTWLDPNNVIQWVENIEQVLVALNVGSSNDYTKNSGEYVTELRKLIAYYGDQTSSIPAGRRKLVTNHDTLTYFAEAYGFDVVGVVTPGGSTLGEPSAGDLVQLLEKMKQENACAIFMETTANDQLAGSLAAELDHCVSVAVVVLYTGALGPEDSPAGSYLGMMRANINAIVEALQ